jgi:hypothetical protein
VGAGFLGSVKAGALLYFAHIAASLFVGLVVSIGRSKSRGVPKKTRQSQNGSNDFADAFVTSVSGSVRSILLIAAYVVLFSAINELLSYTGFTDFIAGLAGMLLPAPGGDAQFFSHAVTGIFEVTNGCAAAANSSGMAALILIAVILSWCGLSVQFQVMSIVKETEVSVRPFILTRFLHMLFSALITWGLFSAFPSAVPLFAVSVQTFALNPDGISTAIHPAPAVCAMLFICAILLLSLAEV